MNRTRITCLTLSIISLFCTTSIVIAEQFAFAGARAAGMGGANAASTRDSTAIWHNPAAFGFMGREWETNKVDNGDLSGQGFSMEVISLNAGYSLTEDLGRYLDILGGIDFDSFEKGTLENGGNNVKSLLSVAGVVGRIDDGDAIYADANAGLSVQLGRLGIGVRMFAEGTGYALPDRDNLFLNSYAAVSELRDELDTAAGNDGFVWNGSYSLSVDQRTKLSDALGDTGPDSDRVRYLDAKLGELAAAGELEGADIASAVDTFSKLTDITGTSIDSNQTAVVGRGFAVVEIPVSYGWAVNENLSFGITAKAMFGSVLGTQIWIFNEDNEEVFDDLSDNINSSVNFGLDLGVLYRLNNFQFGLVGHNLNRPTFDGFTETVNVNGTPQTVKIPDVKIDPQVTFGAAFIPWRRVVLETNIDLLETGTLLDGYDIQRVSFGGEVDLWAVALRLGAYKNIAVSWQDYWVATAGLGANIFGVRFDLGGAYSMGDNTDFDGKELPTEARLFANFGLDF